jgi:hypothetical protein
MLVGRLSAPHDGHIKHAPRFDAPHAHRSDFFLPSPVRPLAALAARADETFTYAPQPAHETWDTLLGALIDALHARHLSLMVATGCGAGRRESDSEPEELSAAFGVCGAAELAGRGRAPRFGAANTSSSSSSSTTLNFANSDDSDSTAALRGCF